MATKKTKTKDERVAEFRKEMRRVRDRERRFRKMTPAQKRMAVARDVISQVAARKIPQSESRLAKFDCSSWLPCLQNS